MAISLGSVGEQLMSYTVSGCPSNVHTGWLRVRSQILTVPSHEQLTCTINGCQIIILCIYACAFSYYIVQMMAYPLALSPGLLIGGRGKEGLVSTACACAVIIQILNNPITYGYCLYTFMDTFTVKYTENVAHVHAVDTRPSPPSPQSEGLGTRLHTLSIHLHRAL